MTRINTKPRKKNAPRAKWRVAEGFKKWIRGRTCIINNHECAGRMEACHVDYAGGKGMGLKVADMFCVPMCEHHHREQHKGWKSFEKKYRIKAIELAEAFWRAWPGRIKWERELERHSS